jgi:hypothetical protein
LYGLHLNADDVNEAREKVGVRGHAGHNYMTKKHQQNKTYILPAYLSDFGRWMAGILSWATLKTMVVEVDDVWESWQNAPTFLNELKTK